MKNDTTDPGTRNEAVSCIIEALVRGDLRYADRKLANELAPLISHVSSQARRTHHVWTYPLKSEVYDGKPR